MPFTETEIDQLLDFVASLNSAKDSVVVVEGKHDAQALQKLGFSGVLLRFHDFGGMVSFADSVAQYRRVIVLFDMDQKGRYLTRRAIRLLERRTKIDTSFKNRLCKITSGKIMFIEQLGCCGQFAQNQIDFGSNVSCEIHTRARCPSG